MADTTEAQIGSQVLLAYWNVAASPDVYTNIGNIRSMSGLGLSRAEVDSTTLDSLAVERIPGLPDGQSFTVVFATGTGTMDLIEGFIDAGTTLDLRVTFPAPLTEIRYFSIVPLGYDHGSITPTGLLELTLTGRITGSITSVNPHV